MNGGSAQESGFCKFGRHGLRPRHARPISLPPGLIISMQLLMGTLFGILGLALATPLAALGMTLVQETYVRRYLDLGKC